MSDVATITVQAFHAKLGTTINRNNGKPIEVVYETTTDVPADVLGEAAAQAMQAAWRTGVDGTEIELRIKFS